MESFSKTTLLEKIPLQFLNLALEQISRLVDQADERIGSHLRRCQAIGIGTVRPV